MATSTDYLLRSGQLRRAGALVSAPRVAIAAILWLLLIEVLPVPAAWVALAVVVGGTICGVVGEPVIVRLLWWARRPPSPLEVPGDPQIQVLVTRRRVAGIGQAGRRYLIVPAAWVARTDLPALLAGARLRQLASAGRLEVAYQWFTWPLQVIGSFVGGFARAASRLPLIGVAWRARWMVAGIAVWQTVGAGHVPATVGIVVVMGFTYLLPWTRSHHERLVFRSLAELPRTSATPVVRRPAEPIVQPTAAGMAPGATRSRQEISRPCGQWRSHQRLASCRGESQRGWPRDHRTTGRNGSR